jgi:hypothetical protein
VQRGGWYELLRLVVLGLEGAGWREKWRRCGKGVLMAPFIGPGEERRGWDGGGRWWLSGL